MFEEEYSRFPDDAEMQREFESQKPILESRREELFNKIDNEPDDVKIVSGFFSNSDLVEELRSSANLTIDHISSSHGVTPEALDSYYKFSKFKYECGMYNDAEEMLGNYLSVNQSQISCILSARWGRLACRILGAKWDLASQDLAAIKDAIDIRNVTPSDLLRQRAWLLHWALFVHINQRDGVDALVDFFSEKVYLQTLENLCPWLLRYYTAFVVLSPSRRRTILRDIVLEIQSMAYQYSDPMTQFLTALYIDFDFIETHKKLLECQALMKNDFFLQIYTEKFMHEARMLLFEVYCTINSRLDLTTLSNQLDMSSDEVERWIVEIVVSSSGGTNLDAKIDSVAKEALISPPNRAAYQQIIDRTKDITIRSAALINNMAGLLQDQAGFIHAYQSL